MIAGAPIKVVATLLGLFGNDNNKYRWISATLTQINSAQSFDSSVKYKAPKCRHRLKALAGHFKRKVDGR